MRTLIGDKSFTSHADTLEKLCLGVKYLSIHDLYSVPSCSAHGTLSKEQLTVQPDRELPRRSYSKIVYYEGPTVLTP